jgi:ABC-type branched-subunit amino acid transport system substrate-binding protein
LARDCFIKRSLLAGKPEPLKFTVNADNPENLAEQFKKEGIEGLIMFDNSKNSLALLEELKKINSHIPVFGTLALLDEENFSERDLANVTFISTHGIERFESGVFRKEYQKTYGSVPGMVAELAFDGMNLLIKATGNAGTDRESIQKALLKIRSDGVTGTIKFDEKGNRIGGLSMIQIKNGEPVLVEKY